MLSVLIPVYNHDVRLLAEELAQQCAASGVPWEILCIDDGSSPESRTLNRELRGRPGIRYEELPHNAGRAAIRNLLAGSAQYPYLLFMDCDSAVVRADYIAQYAARLDPEMVLYGGRVYAPIAPEDKRYLLHWKFGTIREQVPAEDRAKRPWHAFMTNNFVVPKAIFDSIRFEERIRGYGHEDTLFGMELQRRGVPVLHLDNPLEHIGLETAEVFLHKNDEAMRNLAWLWQEAAIPVQTRLLDLARHLETTGLDALIRPALDAAMPLLRNVLLSSRPALWALDMYKLCRLLHARKHPSPTL